MNEKIKVVFRAVTVDPSGSMNRIITVLAVDEKDAVEVVTRELSKNPSRRPYLNKWIEGGRIVVRGDRSN